MHTWFHYLREGNKHRIHEGFLKPANHFIRYDIGPDSLPEMAREPVTFGLHCPEPDICVTNTPEINPNTPFIKEQTACRQMLYLLQITSLTSDQLFVADTGVFTKKDDLIIPSTVPVGSPKEKALIREFRKTLDPLYEAYWNSLIPFADYELGSYKEPEVICFTPIPVEYIKVLKKIDDFIKPVCIAPDFFSQTRIPD